MEDYPTPDSPNDLVFRSPNLRETFGSPVFVVVFIILALQTALIIAITFYLTGPTQGYSVLFCSALVVIGITLWFWVLSANHARLILTHDCLVEYNHFNFRREFPYDQICNIHLGSHKGEVLIRYDPDAAGGEIDYKRVRTVKLVSVNDRKGLYRELAMRITAQEADRHYELKKVGIVLLATILFLLVNIVALWALAGK